jgi:hypothetical protein
MSARGLHGTAWLVVLLACGGAPQPAGDEAERRAAAAADTGFAEVQARGREAMGVDQYTSTHVFQPLPDGGRVTLQRDTEDPAGREQILAHMGEIARKFASGDFRVPGFVHAREVPGTRVMAARRAEISYAVESLPRGGALRLRTSDSAAVAAIHEFLAFQRSDHRAGAAMHHPE